MSGDDKYEEKSKVEEKEINRVGGRDYFMQHDRQ